jgi:hypothetical protein
MHNEEIEEITLRFLWADFDNASSLEQNDDPPGTCSPRVIKLDDSTLLLTEPLSLTVMGPWGPALNLGDLIKVTLLDDGTYRYVGTAQKARVYTWQSESPVMSIDQDGVRHILDQVIEAGGMFEWTVGVLRIQFPLGEDDKGIPVKVKRLFEDLSEVLIEAENLPARPGDSPWLTNTSRNTMHWRRTSTP